MRVVMVWLTPFFAAGFLAPMVDFLGGSFLSCSAAAVGDMDSAASTLGPSPLSASLMGMAP